MAEYGTGKNRPDRYQGNIVFNVPGLANAPSVDFATGRDPLVGSNIGSAPFGVYPINSYSPKTQRLGLQGWDIGAPGGYVPDAKYPNRSVGWSGMNRSDLMIHRSTMRTNDVDKLYSSGCLVVPQNQWVEFRDTVRSLQKQGIVLAAVVSPTGQVTIVQDTRPASERRYDPDISQFIDQTKQVRQVAGVEANPPMSPPLPKLRPDTADRMAKTNPAYANVDNRLEKPMVTPDVVPNPQMVPRISKTMPPTEAPLAPPTFQPASLAPPTYQTASLAPDMPASMVPWNRTTATDITPNGGLSKSEHIAQGLSLAGSSIEASNNATAALREMWEAARAQRERASGAVQIGSVDPMVNQAADIYRQTMGVPMPNYLDAARESAAYRPANMPAYTPARMVPDTPANMTPDRSVANIPPMWTQNSSMASAFKPANMVPDTPARMVPDTPARQAAWDAPIPPSPFDQVASIAQPSVAAPARVSAPPAPSAPDAQTAWETWNTGGARIVPADGAFNLPSMPAPLSPPAPPTPATRTVTEQVINPEWQKWQSLQTAYPEAQDILYGLGPGIETRTNPFSKYIDTTREAIPATVPQYPMPQFPQPGIARDAPTVMQRSPVQQFFHTVLDGAHSLGSGNLGAVGGLLGNMVWRNTLSVPEQARLMQAGVNPTYGGYTPTAFHSAAASGSASGGPNYDYTTGTDASGNFKSTYTADNGNTYSISEWPDSFSAPPNSTPFEVSWG